MAGIRKASKKEAKLKIALTGPSGSGKTYSSLKLAKGLLGGSLEKVIIIDTENSSADLYSDLGDYSVFEFPPPFSPQQYVKAIELCEKEGFEVIIIDSITHEWNGAGGCLEIHEKLGGRFQDWAKVGQMHRAFIDKMLQSSSHIIATVRKKEEYAIEEVNNKKVVRKLGLKEETRDGFLYEVSLVLDINQDHYATATKDRMNLFYDGIPFLIDESTGEKLRQWNSQESK